MTVAAAKWPMLLVGVLLGVLALIATPVAIVALADGGPMGVGRWIAVFVGALLFAGLALAWAMINDRHAGSARIAPLPRAASAGSSAS